MRRLVFAAVAGLCTVAPARAQDGAFAPTLPVIPAPALPGVTVAPTGGTPSAGRAVSRPFAASKWSPVRSPVVAASGMPAPVTPATPATAPLPALPPGAVIPYGGSCADGACGREHRSCGQQLKAWLCFRYSPSDLPKCQPTPYITPLQGMFPCVGCGRGSGVGAPPAQPPIFAPIGPDGVVPGTVVEPAPPMPQPAPPKGVPLPVPQPLPPNKGAGPVEMPPRGTTGGAFAPAWRVQPATPTVTSAGSWRPALPVPVSAGQK
jgi:hypothetical protein